METLRKHFVVRSQELPLDLVWEYRQKRVKLDWFTNMPVSGINMYDVSAIAYHIRNHGIDPIELTILRTKALVTDGTNRILAAKKLGIKKIPVKLKVVLDLEPIQPRFHHPEDYIPLNPQLSHLLRSAFLE